MLSTLTQADVAKLLAEPSPAIRSELAGKLAGEIDNPALSDAETALAQDIVRLMAKDVEISVRQALAQNLRDAVRLPHDVAVRLAADVDSVALPILEHSKVLTDSDLIEIVRGGSPTKQTSIAAREGVSEKVTEVLIVSGDEKAVARLMENATATITEASLTKAIDRFAASDNVKEKMAKRAVLPPAVAERLVSLVALNIRDYLVRHHQISPAAAADIVMQSRERAVLGLSGGSSEQELEKLVTQMHANRRLTPSLTIRALCMGDIAFFEMAIAVMAQIPVLNARILLHDAGKLGLKSLYERTGMPLSLLPAIRVAMDVVRETDLDGGDRDRERFRARVIERILTQCEEMDKEDVDYLLDKLRDDQAAALS